MRLALKAVMLIAVICGAVSYTAYLQTGTLVWPMWTEKTMAGIARVKENASRVLTAVSASEGEDSAAGIIYKWTDADGVLQYTNVLPPQGTNAEIVQVDPNANLITAVAAPQSGMESVPAAASPIAREKPSAQTEQTIPYVPEQIKKILNDARDAQQIMKKQQQTLEKL